jgi:predicted RNA-binding Zn-ribbon protein involved in translation (DUF1610 family)
MGAIYRTVTLIATNQEDAIKEAKLEMDDLRSEYGVDTYAGHLGIKDGITFMGDFDTEEEANKVLKSNDKWGNAYLVSYKKPVVAPNDAAKIKELEKSSYALKDTEHLFHRGIVERIRNQKSQFKGCTGCGSKISVKYIATTNCPLCGESFMTETDKKRLAQVKESVIKKKEAIKEAIAKIRAKQKTSKQVYVLGGWCPD